METVSPSAGVIASAIAHLRMRHGSESEASRALGLNESYLTNLRKGKFSPTLRVLDLLGIEIVFRGRRNE